MIAPRVSGKVRLSSSQEEEGKGEEIREQNGQFPGNQQSDLQRRPHHVITKNVCS
jgi:hypothetical protein